MTGAPHFRVEESDLAEADREAAFLHVLSFSGPDYAAQWHSGLLRAIGGLADFPGPRSHAVVREARAERREVRRMLYPGPKGSGKRGGVRYRVLFTIIEPEAGDEGVIRVLRVLHGAQQGAPEEGEV